MVGRTCAGVGSALIAMFTMLPVGALGGDSERQASAGGIDPWRQFYSDRAGAAFP